MSGCCCLSLRSWGPLNPEVSTDSLSHQGYNSTFGIGTDAARDAAWAKMIDPDHTGTGTFPFFVPGYGAIPTAYTFIYDGTTSGAAEAFNSGVIMIRLPRSPGESIWSEYDGPLEVYLKMTRRFLAGGSYEDFDHPFNLCMGIYTEEQTNHNDWQFVADLPNGVEVTDGSDDVDSGFLIPSSVLYDNSSEGPFAAMIVPSFVGPPGPRADDTKTYWCEFTVNSFNVRRASE